MRPRHATALLSVALVAACQSAPPPQELKLGSKSWTQLMTRLPSALGPAAELEKQRQRHGIPLRFRVGDAVLARGQERIVDHPHCGGMLRVFVRSLPPREPHRVGSEEVFELDAQGGVLRRWPIPPDMRVTAIDGEQILVPHAVALPDGREIALTLRVSSDGSFRVEPRARALDPEPTRCPSGIGDRPNEIGPQHRCWRFSESGQTRVIAYEGACLAVRS